MYTKQKRWKKKIKKIRRRKVRRSLQWLNFRYHFCPRTNSAISMTDSVCLTGHLDCNRDQRVRPMLLAVYCRRHVGIMTSDDDVGHAPRTAFCHANGPRFAVRKVWNKQNSNKFRLVMMGKWWKVFSISYFKFSVSDDGDFLVVLESPAASAYEASSPLGLIGLLSMLDSAECGDTAKKVLL